MSHRDDPPFSVGNSLSSEAFYQVVACGSAGVVFNDRARAMKILPLLSLVWVLTSSVIFAAVSHEPAYPNLANGNVQYASFPKPLETYPPANGSMMETIKARAAADPFNVAATVVFLLAILHTFAAGPINRLAHHYEHLHEEQLRVRGVRDKLHPDGVAEVSFKATLLHFLG